MQEHMLPSPTGYHILIKLKPLDEKIGAIFIPDKTRERESVASILGQVVRLGPDSYTGDRFPNGPWCKEGDWVMFRSYAGCRFKISDIEYRIVNDDAIESVVPDPSIIERA